MNNSKLAIEYSALSEDSKIDQTPIYREKEGELIKIIAAIQGIAQTKEWSTLKDKVFDTLVKNLTKDIQDEATKQNPDGLKLNRLAGQLQWAEKYSDLTKLEKTFRLDLTHIRTQLYGNKS